MDHHILLIHSVYMLLKPLSFVIGLAGQTVSSSASVFMKPKYFMVTDYVQLSNSTSSEHNMMSDTLYARGISCTGRHI